MFLDHFGLATNPFGLSPRLDFLYQSTAFQESMAHMVYGVDNSEAIVMITGAIGTGKTMAVQSFLTNLGSSFCSALVTNTNVSPLELLKLVLEDLDVSVPTAADKSDVLIIFKDYLIEQSKAGKRVLVVIDEAQNLGTEVLEEIRLLTNLGQGDAQPVQLILLGQPELIERVSVPELAQLRQRIRVHYHLDTLTRKEVGEYIDHRMRVAGCEREVFTSGAIDRISEYSGGVPRLVNSLCGNGLLSAFVADRDEVGAEDINPDELMGTRDVMRAKLDNEEVLGQEAASASPVESTSPAPSSDQEQELTIAPIPMAERRRDWTVWWVWPAIVLLIVIVASGWWAYQKGYLRFSLPADLGEETSGLAQAKRPSPILVQEEDTLQQRSGQSMPDDGYLGQVDTVDNGAENNVAELLEVSDGTLAQEIPEDLAAEEGTVETPPLSAQPAATPEVYEIHIASFKTREQAQALVERVRTTVGEGFLYPVDVDGEQWYRVYLGPYGNKDTAEAVVDQLLQTESLECFIMMKKTAGSGRD